MDASLESVTPSESSPAQFRDLDVVRLVEDIRTDEGLFPRGSRGTVVLVYESAHAYEVEFDQPQADVVTLREDQLAAV